jgi:tetratricopeptide (TPR) repeat protein
MQAAFFFVMVSAIWGRAAAQEAVEPAEPDRDREAQIHFEAGRLHFDRGSYEQALPEFQAAYDLSNRPALLYNLYITHENLGHLDEAAQHLERFLAEGEVEPEQRTQLTARLDNLKRRAREEAAREERDAAAVAAAALANAEPVYEHLGFFFRGMLGFGFGLASVSIDVPISMTQTYHGTLNATGTSTSIQLAVGWAFFENLVFQLEFFGTTMLAGDISASGNPPPIVREALASVKTKYNALGAMLGATYYFMPINIYASLSGGLALATLDRPMQPSDDRIGLAVAASAGKEWWIDDEWGLGLGLSYYLTATGQAGGASTRTLVGHALGIFITISFN